MFSRFMGERISVFAGQWRLSLRPEGMGLDLPGDVPDKPSRFAGHGGSSYLALLASPSGQMLITPMES